MSREDEIKRLGERELARKDRANTRAEKYALVVRPLFQEIARRFNEGTLKKRGQVYAWDADGVHVVWTNTYPVPLGVDFSAHAFVEHHRSSAFPYYKERGANSLDVWTIEVGGAPKWCYKVCTAVLRDVEFRVGPRVRVVVRYQYGGSGPCFMGEVFARVEQLIRRGQFYRGVERVKLVARIKELLGD